MKRSPRIIPCSRTTIVKVKRDQGRPTNGSILREVVNEIQLHIGNHRVKDPTEPLDGLLLLVVDTPNDGLG